MVKALEGVKGAVSSEVEAMTAHEHLISRLKATYLGMYKNGKEEKGKQEVAAT
jgi:hypothetical protein